MSHPYKSYVPNLEPRVEPRTQPDSACYYMDDWVFEDSTTQKIAKETCRGCNVRVECIKFELEMNTSSGIRGALTAEERDKLRPLYLAKLAGAAPPVEES